MSPVSVSYYNDALRECIFIHNKYPIRLVNIQFY